MSERDDYFDQYRAQGYVICRLKAPSSVEVYYDRPGGGSVCLTCDGFNDWHGVFPLREEDIAQIGEENVERLQ